MARIGSRLKRISQKCLRENENKWLFFVGLYSVLIEDHFVFAINQELFDSFSELATAENRYAKRSHSVTLLLQKQKLLCEAGQSPDEALRLTQPPKPFSETLIKVCREELDKFRLLLEDHGLTESDRDVLAVALVGWSAWLELETRYRDKYFSESRK
jgi:hypothetical protein